MNDELRDVLNQELAKFAGQIMRHVDERIDRLEAKVDANAEQANRALDSIAKRLNDDEAERAAITAQLDRHERWHHQAADTLHLKLDY